ncbi:hypothetical protein AHF37_07175 [Paragonimus kellicotti]|nr:hypothetical protein AHF37_07175 [Paragonimus kellicotti]
MNLIMLWRGLVSKYFPIKCEFKRFASNHSRVFFETYGCQMNHSDTEVAKSLLNKAGFQQASSLQEFY